MSASRSKYKVLERLAVGGMGEVFLARQEGIGGFARAVVLKKLLPDMQAEDDATRRFLDEARIAASLLHPNVVSIIEVGTEEGGPAGEPQGAPFIALEYVHGENVGALRQRAKKAGEPIPVAVAARIVADAALGLQHAHDAKDASGRALHIIHRDVSPKNIFVRVDGTSKIGDFGVARSEHRLSKTATGAVPGTLSYMSPEQASAKEMGPASDQFSLGIVLWELLTGERLFKADSAIETIRMLLGKRIPAPGDKRREAGLLDDVVLRMLQRDPAKRFATLLHAVDAIYAAMPECEGETGACMVADLVEDLAGDELRKRQSRIEEGLTDEITELAPKAARGSVEPTTDERKRNTPGTPATPHVEDIHAARTSLQPDATVRDVRDVRGTTPRRGLVAAAVLAAVVVAGGAGAATLLREPSDEERTRAFLREAAVRHPFLHRETFLAMARLDEIDGGVAQKTAHELVMLMEQRLELLLEHWQLDEAARVASRVELEKRERALEDAARRALAALGNEDLAVEALDMWAYDSAAPSKWLEPDDALTIQSDLRTGALEGMHGQREIRDIAVPAMLKRACADGTLGKLSPLVDERERLVERFAAAPPGELVDLDHAIDELEERVRTLLDEACGPALGPAVASGALHFISDPEEKEPLFPMLPSVREEKRGTVLSR